MNPAEFDPNHSDEISALLAVAAEGSFVAAGRLLGRHPTVVSRRLSAMEERLGVRLIERSTRQVCLTETGAQLAERLRSAVNSITEAEQEATAGAADARGVLRLAFPAAMGRIWLGPMLSEFLSIHPHVSISVDYSERFVDIIGEGFDAAVRIGELADSRLIATKLCDHRRILCASPDYLERCGSPQTPRDLSNHNILRFTGFASFPEWRLTNGHAHETVTTTGTLTANDSESLLAAAKNGIGILGAGDWLVRRDIALGNLVRVLPDWNLDGSGAVYLVRPSAKFTAAKTIAFRDWITAKFASGAVWDVSNP